MVKEIRYPFREVGSRAAPTEAEARSLAHQSREAGVRSGPAGARASSRWAAKALFAQERPGDMPQWLLAMVERRALPEEVLQTLRRRLARAPTEANLRLAQHLVNDVLRQRGGAEALRGVLNQRVLTACPAKRRGGHVSLSFVALVYQHVDRGGAARTYWASRGKPGTTACPRTPCRTSAWTRRLAP